MHPAPTSSERWTKERRSSALSAFQSSQLCRWCRFAPDQASSTTRLGRVAACRVPPSDAGQTKRHRHFPYRRRHFVCPGGCFRWVDVRDANGRSCYLNDLDRRCGALDGERTEASRPASDPTGDSDRCAQRRWHNHSPLSRHHFACQVSSRSNCGFETRGSQRRRPQFLVYAQTRTPHGLLFATKQLSQREACPVVTT